MIFFGIKHSLQHSLQQHTTQSLAYNTVFKAANTPQSPTQVVLHIHSTLIAGSIDYLHISVSVFSLRSVFKYAAYNISLSINTDRSPR